MTGAEDPGLSLPSPMVVHIRVGMDGARDGAQHAMRGAAAYACCFR